MAKILILANQTILREALEILLSKQDDMEVVGTADNAADAPALCRTLQPDLVFVSIVTENNTGVINYTTQIRKEFPAIKIVMLAAWPGINREEEASKAGAHSYLHSYKGNKYLFHVIRNTLKGYSIYSKVWFNTPQLLAAAETKQRIGDFGIKPDGIINFLSNEPPFQYNSTLKIPQGLPCGGSFRHAEGKA